MMQNLKSGDSEKKTLVEEGTHFKGSLTSICPIVVRGRIEGDVQAPSLRISETGAVHGKVKVGEIISEGELAGEFDADLIQLSGSVKDKTIVRAKSLQVKLGVANGKMEVVFGECLLDIGEMPDKQTAINASLSDGRPGPRPAASEPPNQDRAEGSTVPQGETNGGAGGSSTETSTPAVDRADSAVRGDPPEPSAVAAEMLSESPRRRSASPPKR
jgi:cytoskeletal protein CcmA (bactofilin family)